MGRAGAHGSPSRRPASFISHTQARAPVRAFLDSKWSSVSCDAKARSLLWPPASQGWHLSPGLRHLSRVISLKRNSGTSLSPWVLEAALWWRPSPQGVRVKLRFCVSRARAARTAEVAGAARSSPLYSRWFAAGSARVSTALAYPRPCSRACNRAIENRELFHSGSRRAAPRDEGTCEVLNAAAISGRKSRVAVTFVSLKPS